MSAAMSYQVRTVLLGLLGVPLLVSLPTALLGLPFKGGLGLSVGAIVALTISFVVWMRRGRKDDRPDGWLAAILPVALPPGAFLLAWVVTFGVTGSLGTTLDIAAWATLPYLLLGFAVALGGFPLLLPITLAAVLIGSVAGFVAGARRPPAPRGGASLIGVLAGSLAVVIAAGVQLAPRISQQLRPPSMSAEVDLYEYRPFKPHNRLVTPVTPPSLTISGNHPRLDGATALYPVYAAIGQATYRLPDGLGEEERSGFVDEYLDCNTTTIAYEGLIEGDTDAIFVAQPSKGQLAAAKAAGVTLKLTPIGREAFVFFVNTDNPVRNLTLDQIRNIYSRTITNWNQVGGKDEEILSFQRPDDSGSQTAMLALVMKDRPIAQPMREEVATGMGSIIQQVAEYRDLSGALGYSFRWYATVMNSNPNIRLLAVDGVEPTVENIRNGSYPLTADLNIVTKDSSNPSVSALLDWVVGAEGQALIEKAGYVGR